MSEEWLAASLQQHTAMLRAALPAPELPVLLARDLAESMQLANPNPCSHQVSEWCLVVSIPAASS